MGMCSRSSGFWKPDQQARSCGVVPLERVWTTALAQLELLMSGGTRMIDRNEEQGARNGQRNDSTQAVPERLISNPQFTDMYPNCPILLRIVYYLD